MDARKISIITIAVIFAAVISATFLRFPPDWTLAGVETKPSSPQVTANSWFTGKFTADAEHWLTRRFGFRGAAIRLAHQLDWEFYRILPEPGTKIDIGLDHWIFEHEYIRHYAKRFPMKTEAADTTAARLAALHKALLEDGKALVVCMSPSKPAVYPEKLTEEISPSAKAIRKYTPARDTMAEALEKHGVPYLDGTTTLISWKESSPLLFPANGSHWNAYASQRCFGEIWELARHDIPTLPEIPKVTGYYERPPSRTDSDLSALYNMICYPYAEERVPYPVMGEMAKPAKQVRVLGIGDSFSFQLADAMARTGVVLDYTLFYYFTAIYHFQLNEGEMPDKVNLGKCRVGTIDHTTFDMATAMRDYDVLLIEFNDVFAASLLWGFDSKLQYNSHDK